MSTKIIVSGVATVALAVAAGTAIASSQNPVTVCVPTGDASNPYVITQISQSDFASYEAQYSAGTTADPACPAGLPVIISDKRETQSPSPTLSPSASPKPSALPAPAGSVLSAQTAPPVLPDTGGSGRNTR